MAECVVRRRRDSAHDANGANPARFPTRCTDPFTPARHVMGLLNSPTIVAQPASAPPGRIAALRSAGPRWRRRSSTTLTGETQCEARQVRAHYATGSELLMEK